MPRPRLEQPLLPLNRSELAERCKLNELEILELMEYGAIQPLLNSENGENFSSELVLQLQSANQIRLDYDLDLFTVVIFMDYQHRIQTLEKQLKALEQQLQERQT